jgi:thiaminase
MFMAFLDQCIAFSGRTWAEKFLHHPWIEALFAGKLAEEPFEFWLIQDLPYLSEYVTEMVFPKVPPNNPWVEHQKEYRRRSSESRIELRMLEKVGDWGRERWAARPARDAIDNFWIRTAYEGSFGDICAALYVCYAFPFSFGERYQREAPANLPPLQREWIEQWIDPFAIDMWHATRDGLNEAGAHATEYEKERMKWLFLRGTQLQIGTFDTAWNCSDPWPGEDEEKGVLALPPD